jgi:signal transduction histidine kinase/CheY-like chemotaxis protein
MSDALAPHLHLLLTIIDDPALLVQSDGLVLGANSAMGRQFRVPSRTLPGLRLADLLVTPWDSARAYLIRARGSSQSAIGTLTFRRTTGEVFRCRCYGNLVQAADAGATAVISLRCREHSDALLPFTRLDQRLEELTKELFRRQQAEQRLQHLNRDLEARVREEVAAREHTQARLAQTQRMEALGQLAAGVAHDFNNVLQAVSGGLALILKRADNRELVTQFTRLAMDAAERGATITGRLLAFARRGELRAEAIDAGQMLAGLREMLTPVVGSTVTIRVETEPGKLLLAADRGQLETALINLVVNARDAMTNGGTVTVSAQREVTTGSRVDRDGMPSGHYIRIMVADTGAGMDAATLARATEPFFTTKPVGKGTGLGLAMARGFAQQSGGGFAIESTPGVGTAVTLWFPQSSTVATEAASAWQVTPARATVPASRILLVDDDALVRDVLTCGLEEEGYQVIPMPNGLAALAWLEKGENIDLLITDFSMPGMNGLALIYEVRRSRNTLPALLLTGYADNAVQLALEDTRNQNTQLLRKPIRAEELAEEAAAILATANIDAVPGATTDVRKKLETKKRPVSAANSGV